jgi:hypothetical protein
MSDPNNPSAPRPEQNAPTPPPYSPSNAAPPAGEQQNPYATPQQNPYAQSEQPYGAAPAYGYQQQAPKTNTLAIVSLIASLAGLITGISAIVGIITGHIALGQIKKTGENGRGLALGGVIAGYVITVLGIIAVIGTIAFFAWAASQPGFSEGYYEY